jgi:PAS domain S-box-containing protein
MSKKVLFILMTLGMILFISVVAAGASYYTQNQVTNRLIDQSAAQQEILAKQVGSSLQQQVNSLEEQLFLISQDPQIQSGTAAECNKRLLEIYNSGAVKIGNLGRVGTDGIFHCSLNTKLIGTRAAALGSYMTDIFADPTHTPVMSRAVKPVGAPSYIIAIHVPVWGPNHEFLGTLGGAIYLSDLQAKFLVNTPFATGSTMALYDDDGTILYNPKTDLIGKNIASPEFQALLKNGLPPEKAIADIKNGVSGSLRFGFDNQERISAFVPIEIFPNHRWRIAVAVPVSSIRTQQQLLGVQTLIYELFLWILAAAILIGGLFLWIMIKKVFNPINNLAKSAEKIGNGDFTVRIPDEDSDEVGRLAQVFNKMIIQLKAAHDLLEEKVQARTRDLAEAKAKDEAILASIGEGIVVADSAGKLIYWNKAAETILGIELSETSTNERADTSGIFYPDKITPMPEEKQALALALQGEYIHAMPEFVCNSGVPQGRFISVTAQPICTDEGSIFAAVAIFHDVTKEHEVDQAKTEFVSLASHQLRTPLTAINWYSEMLINGDAGKLTAKQMKYLGEIYTGNQRMVELVNALLNVSRLDLGTLVVEPKPTNLRELAESVIQEQSLQIKTRSIRLETKYAYEPEVISIDQKLMRMVLQNLLSNAIKYTPPEGSVSLHIESGKETDQLLITVIDTGWGITKSQQPRIFEKLFRADNVKEKDTEGTGLGLYLVKSIIENLGGTIRFESKENEGTTFFVELSLNSLSKAQSGLKELA